MADLRESSPFCSSKSKEVLFALKSFLHNLSPPLSTTITSYLDFTIKTFVEQEYDIDIVKETTITEAKELGIKASVLKTIQRNLKPFKK